MTPLLPQQELMLAHLLRTPRACLFADPGLGKTRAALEAVSWLIGEGAIRSALVVAPLRVCAMTWPAEVARWHPWMRTARLGTPEGQAAFRAGEAQLYLINYDRLLQLAAEEGPWPCDMLILDEAHNMKSPSGKRARALFKLRDRFTRIAAMTGTPAPQGLMDLWNPLRITDGGERLGSTQTAFRGRYFESDYFGWKWTPREWAFEAITRRIADITLTLRAGDWLDIPPCDTVDRDVDLPPVVMEQYRTFQRECVMEFEGRELAGVNAAVMIGKLQQFTSGAVYDDDGDAVEIHTHKLRALTELIDSLKGEPVLIATSFVHERERIRRWVTGAEEFSPDVFDRWNKGQVKALVGDPRSIGSGLNLQAGGRHVIWFTPVYSRAQYDQMNARLVRTGQERETIVHRLLCPGTVDWAVVEALRAKGDLQDGLKETLKNLNAL